GGCLFIQNKKPPRLFRFSPQNDRFPRLWLHAERPPVRGGAGFQHVVVGGLPGGTRGEPPNKSQFATLTRRSNFRGRIDIQDRLRPLGQASPLIGGWHETGAPIAGTTRWLSSAVGQDDESG